MAYHQIRGNGQGLNFLNFPFGDTTYTKVFVGGLAWETQSESLHSYFEQFGEILEAVVITDKHTGRSKGYGFVTFRDPEAAKRACADPNPVIDGRRANCNLASFGQPQPSSFSGHMRTPTPSFGSPQTPRGSYIRSPSYHQPVSYSYQTEFSYPPYGYPVYGPEYVCQQGFYNSYLSQNRPQLYGMQGAVNTKVLPYGQIGLPSPSSLGYSTLQNFAMPAHIVQYRRPSVTGVTTESNPSIQTPQKTGESASSLAQTRSIVPNHTTEFTQSSDSD
ncbi:hypothetical protein LguiB_018901 [Lonicera macranthoides]